MSDQLPYWQRLQMIKQGLLPKEAVAKPRKPIKKQSEKKKAELAEQKASGSDGVLDDFFQGMRGRCRGRCFFCNGSTTYKNEELWRIAIAHLLPKSKFPSIATNENNWVELCMACHRSFDDGMISWEMLFDSYEWAKLRIKLLLILPMVSPDEQRNKLYDKLIQLTIDKNKL